MHDWTQSLLEMGLGASTQPPPAQHGGLAIPCWGTDGCSGCRLLGKGPGDPQAPVAGTVVAVVEPHSTLARAAGSSGAAGCDPAASTGVCLGCGTAPHVIAPLPEPSHFHIPLYLQGRENFVCVGWHGGGSAPRQSSTVQGCSQQLLGWPRQGALWAARGQRPNEWGRSKRVAPGWCGDSSGTPAVAPSPAGPTTTALPRRNLAWLVLLQGTAKSCAGSAISAQG